MHPRIVGLVVAAAGFVAAAVAGTSAASANDGYWRHGGGGYGVVEVQAGCTSAYGGTDCPTRYSGSGRYGDGGRSYRRDDWRDYRRDDWRRDEYRRPRDRDYWRNEYRHRPPRHVYRDYGPGIAVFPPIVRYGEPRYVEPRRYPRRVTLSQAHVQWCYNRYRSYRAGDNSFQPYNGPRQQCYSPYS